MCLKLSVCCVEEGWAGESVLKGEKKSHQCEHIPHNHVPSSAWEGMCKVLVMAAIFHVSN